MATYGTAVYNDTTYTLYGFPGSTVRDELNRLANGGNYPELTVYKDEQGAANAWAGTTGKAIVAALNYKVFSFLFFDRPVKIGGNVKFIRRFYLRC